ncbi:MAG TPA: N-acetyl-gamma-glutamyl-phosphate reductase [Solirubrobacteraceae bacterium]|nr:N-acetyl-gamma-glutamyl-phosphate reductase [Solirubrobacteraceae bacterium]
MAEPSTASGGTPIQAGVQAASGSGHAGDPHVASLHTGDQTGGGSVALQTSKRGSAQRFEPGSPRVLVAGATGFAGALAAHLLWRHPRFELAAVTGRSEVGRRLDDLYPRYRVPLILDELDLDGLERIDAAVVAYPHAAAAPAVGALIDRGVRVVDLSADFRLSELATYERWYGAHPRPELLEQAVYGLSELHRERIAHATIVANPGCYPTASVLALAPLARAGLLADVVIDAKQGVSGAGRTASLDTTHLSYTAENIIPYKVAAHRHTPEIEQQLDELDPSRPDLRVQFQAHLVSLDQGEMASCYVTPTRSVAPEELAGLFASAYTDEPFVELVDAPPSVREVRETNFCRLFAAADPHTGKLLVFSAIDNLWKGTSSQAVQNLNLMFGLPETEGLL